MSIKCTCCGGSGYIAVDCPYCRQSDSFEHDHLTPGKCICCGGDGVFEDVCPHCLGAGTIKRHAS